MSQFPQTAADLPTDHIDIIKHFAEYFRNMEVFHVVIANDETCLGDWLEKIIAADKFDRETPDEFDLARDIAKELIALCLKDPKRLELKGQGLRFAGALSKLDEATNRRDMINGIRAVHKTFGAPGNYGYGTPIGDALLKLYKIHDLLTK